MSEKLAEIKNSVTKFLVFNFAITFGMGIVLFFFYKRIDGISEQFAKVQMFYPALVVIGLMIYYEKDKLSSTLLKFFKFFIALFILSFVALLVGIFAFPKYVSPTLDILAVIFSIITFILIIKNKGNSFEKINMVFKKNFKKVFLLALLFIVLRLFAIIISGVIYGEDLSKILKEFVKILGLSSISVPIGVVTSFLLFFGEELGWRGYLQPRLQALFGKKLGVIILGCIWGIWHLPLCFTLYSPKTPGYCVINYIFFCTLMGIFLSFVYMKTENLWSVIIIHLINNTMAVIAIGGYSSVITLKDLIIGIILNMIIYLPFLFTKEYKGELSQEEIESL